MISQEKRRTINQFVDDATAIDPDAFEALLDRMESNAYGVAEHLRSNWQDEPSAKAWERIGRVLAKAQTKIKAEKPY